MAINQLMNAKDLGNIYGIPSMDFQDLVRFHPQVSLHFLEDAYDIANQGTTAAPKPRPRRRTGEVSFRVQNKTYKSITKADLTSIANRIKAQFGGNGYIWHKGRIMCAYKDQVAGYDFRILANTATEGKQLITKTLNLLGDIPDWTHLTLNENGNPATAYPDTPLKENILGELVDMPKRRPVVKVRFQYAVCHIYGLKEPVALYDRASKLVNPLVQK